MTRLQYNCRLSLSLSLDYFLSHSWHDIPGVKWNALVSMAESFARRRHREPLFWLDKVCIDQSRIADGLRMLSVNVMACHKVLVVWGFTYPTRL